jgi:poly(3-hydroxybutyrate) depolymerase
MFADPRELRVVKKACHLKQRIKSNAVAFLLVLPLNLALAQSVILYPRTATVEFATKEPFTAYVNGGAGSQAVDWYVNDVPGGNGKLGTISQDGIYSAPATGGFPVVIKAVSESGSGTATVMLSGSLPPISCTTRRDSGVAGDINCTMQHDSRTRTALVHIPENFVPGTSGLLVALSGGDVEGTWFCQHAGSESLGWSRYLDSLPPPAPLLICPNPVRVAGAGPQWNVIEFDSSHFDPPAPNDSDFIRQWILWAGNNGVNLKAVGVMGMWLHGGTMAYQVARDNYDLVAAVSSYNYNLRNANGDATQAPNVPFPAGPVSVIALNGAAPSNPLKMCGMRGGAVGKFLYSADQLLSHWAAADNITSFNTKKLMCQGYDGKGAGIWTGLDFKKGTTGILNTEVAYFALVGGTTKAYCSANAGCAPVVKLTTPADRRNPYNSQLAENPSLGVTLDDVIWRFFQNHPKPTNPARGRVSK